MEPSHPWKCSDKLSIWEVSSATKTISGNKLLRHSLLGPWACLEEGVLYPASDFCVTSTCFTPLNSKKTPWSWFSRKSLVGDSNDTQKPGKTKLLSSYSRQLNSTSELSLLFCLCQAKATISSTCGKFLKSFKVSCSCQMMLFQNQPIKHSCWGDCGCMKACESIVIGLLVKLTKSCF